MKKILIPALLTLFSALATGAQESDFGLWGSLQVEKKWDNGWYANTRLEYRQRDGGLDLWFLRPTVGYKVAPWLSADLGFDRFENASSVQYRALLSATFTLKQGPLTASLRQRYIRSYNTTASTWGNLFRAQLKTSYAVSGTPFTPFIAIEIYAWEHWKQTHHMAGTRLRLSPHHSFELFYVYATSATRPEAHILAAGYTLTL